VYARSTTVKAQRESMDAGIAQVRDEVLPAVMGMSGCLGLSMLVDRRSGECIVTTSWESKEAMDATAEMVKPLRDRASEILSGTASVQEWEIAVMHREHRTDAASCARSTWLTMDPAHMDNALEVFRTTVLPRMESMPGFCSASMLVDRAGGMAVSTAAFEDAAALDANRAEADRMRSAATAQTQAQVLDVREYELALAHLHVPELV
jgi:quinol monooxygenase YgiN